jgi:MFS family permease
MLALLRRRPDFRRLWLASSVSLVGDWLTLVAVSLLVLDRGGSPWALAVVYAAHALPQALSAPLAGPIADRFDRRRVLLGANLAQAVVTASMALAALRGSIGAVQLLVLARSALSALVVPAETAALPRLVHDDELVPANALIAATWSVSYVGGMALGGALATLGPATAIGIDALTFCVAAWVLRPMPSLPPMRPARELAEGSLWTAPREMGAAFAHALRDRRLLRALSAKSPLALAGGAGWIAINLVTATSHPFGSAAISLGIVQAVRGAGTGIGPLVASRLVARGSSSARLLVLVSTLSWGSMLLFVLAPNPLWILVASLSWGIGVGSNWVLSTVALQRHAPSSMLGRLAALDELGATMGMVLGALAGGRLVTNGVPIANAVGIVVALSSSLWIALWVLSSERHGIVPVRADSE